MSEIAAMNHTALTLQRAPSMKSIFVGLLAVFALSGCGVGMDDPEGEQAALGTTRQAVIATNTVSPQPELRGPIPLVALPQDPIPDYEGKTVRPPGTKLTQ